ncbi:MAG: coproporphyrinogen III oxidase [Rhizobiales bacterium]|nr:coproporphyrinogen III oxidase [Hyphomicrobiales bacterium]
MAWPYHAKGDPFGIYIHWPFCAAKCPYCDFNSHVRHKPVDQEVYVEAYEREIAHIAALTPGREVSSIFFGGGTPSLMAVSTVDRILQAVSKYWNIIPNAEISLEANPTSIEANRFKGYRKAGVNRVSAGVQSLDDEQLKFLGRLHTADEARRAIDLAREVFPRLSFDLIYARPRQTMEDWEKELNSAIDLAADHLSLYQLTIEEGTPFFELHKRGKLAMPAHDLSADLYELTQQVTADRGLPNYEISNHAAKGKECQHNLIYWRYQDYAGIGPGAHGRLSIDGKKIATVTEYNPEIWWQKAMADGHGMKDNEILGGEATADEFLLMGLRLREGIDPKRYTAFCGKTLNLDKKKFLIEKGFLEESKKGQLRATPSGSMVLDALVADLAA